MLFRSSGKSQLTARYNLYDIKSINARNVGGLNAVGRGTALNDDSSGILSLRTDFAGAD